MLVGGFGPELPATPDTQYMVEWVRHDIMRNVPQGIESLRAVSFQTQVTWTLFVLVPLL
jgi:hypothetical protein